MDSSLPLRDGRQAVPIRFPPRDRRSQFTMLMEAPGTLTVDAAVIVLGCSGWRSLCLQPKAQNAH